MLQSKRNIQDKREGGREKEETDRHTQTHPCTHAHTHTQGHTEGGRKEGKERGKAKERGRTDHLKMNAVNQKLTHSEQSRQCQQVDRGFSKQDISQKKQFKMYYKLVKF